MIETKLLRASGTRKWQEIIFLITPSEAAWNGQLWEFHQENRLPVGPANVRAHPLRRVQLRNRCTPEYEKRNAANRIHIPFFLYFSFRCEHSIFGQIYKYYGSMFVANIEFSGNFTNRVPFLNIK